jgi:glycosyltransferase involved in cell wall biosynthesis
MAKYLPEFGIEPIVLTVDPDYASYPLLDETLRAPEGLKVHRTQSFEPLRIYAKIFGKSKVPYSGFSNVDTQSPISKLSRYIRGNFFIPDARRGWNKYALQVARKLIRENNVDQIITTGPPHSTHLIGLELRKEFEFRWYADFRDPWTDIYYYDDLLLTEANQKKDKNLELEVLQKSDIVFSVCPSNQAILKNKLSADEKGKVKLLTNGFDEEDFGDSSVSEKSDILNIVYTGTIAPSYNSIPFFEIFKSVPFKWKLTFAGNMSVDVRKWFEENDLTKNLDYQGYVSHDEAIELLKKGDLLLHIVPDTEKNRMGTTGKLFEYIGARRPILNLGPKEGDSADFIAEAGAGKTFLRHEKNEILAFLDAVKALRIVPGSEANKFSRKQITQELSEFLLATAS